MNKAVVSILVLALIAGAAQAQALRGQREPYIGYGYPAGGRQGTTFQITVGGQYLATTRGVFVSGSGVRASVVDYLPPYRSIRFDRLPEFRHRILTRIAQLTGGPLPPPLKAATPAPAPTTPAAPATPAQPGDAPAPPAPAPRPEPPPLLANLDKLSLWSVEQIRTMLQANLDPRSRVQNKVAIGETVILEVTIDADAPPGDRDLRLITRTGLSNPLVFEVGRTLEVWEHEPNSRTDKPTAAFDPPVTLNGQIMPGDQDTFRLKLRQGQKMVIQVQARHLIPYLADAVPGWFQPTAALFGPENQEVAYQDDYRFHPDPVVLYEVPSDGEYVLEIADSIYRGREDFVYRVHVGEQPFVTHLFPLGGREGNATPVTLTGWNLLFPQMQLDTTPGGPAVRQAVWDWPEAPANPLPYAVDTLPEATEVEPNGTRAAAQRVTLPLIINGRIEKPGDVDVFRLEGRAGEELVAEVMARRLDSPLDSLLRLMNASGRPLAWNDDHPDQEAALITHHADSYLRFRLPAAGTYYVQLSDTSQHGGSEYAYRLRISGPRPDFAVRMVPASLSVPAGRVASVTVYAFRKDGFEGEIEVSLENAPPGFSLAGGRIPPGQNQVTMTLTGPPRALPEPEALRLVGSAQIGERTVTRPVVPATNMMQAFAYQHLVPAQNLSVLVTGAGRAVSVLPPPSAAPLLLPARGTLQTLIKTTPGRQLPPLELEVREGPEGLTVTAVAITPEGALVTLQTGEKTPQPGYENNLILEAFTYYQVKRPDGSLDPNKRRVSLGLWPAMPYRIVPIE